MAALTHQFGVCTTHLLPSLVQDLLGRLISAASKANFSIFCQL